MTRNRLRIARVGERSGRLLALRIEIRPYYEHGQTYRRTGVVCACACGAEVWVTNTQFVRGQRTSCGCAPTGRPRGRGPRALERARTEARALFAEHDARLARAAWVPESSPSMRAEEAA